MYFKGDTRFRILLNDFLMTTNLNHFIEFIDGICIYLEENKLSDFYLKRLKRLKESLAQDIILKYFVDEKVFDTMLKGYIEPKLTTIKTKYDNQDEIAKLIESSFSYDFKKKRNFEKAIKSSMELKMDKNDFLRQILSKSLNTKKVMEPILEKIREVFETNKTKNPEDLNKTHLFNFFTYLIQNLMFELPDFLSQIIYDLLKDEYFDNGTTSKSFIEDLKFKELVVGILIFYYI